MKLAFKKFTPDDFDDYFRLVGDGTVMAMITERALPRDEAVEDFEQRVSRNGIADDFGYYKVIDADSRAFVGLAKLEVEHAASIEAELGYILLPEYWGKGVGGRVAKLLVDRARTLPQLASLYAIIDPLNVPSRKILTNNGFVSKAFQDFDGLPGELLVLNLRSSVTSSTLADGSPYK